MAQDIGQTKGAIPAAGWRAALALGRFALALAVRLGLAAVVLAGMLALALAMSGRSLPVPQRALAQLEARLNAALRPSLPGASLALRGIDLSLTSAFAPRLVLRDMRLTSGAGRPVVQLPQLAMVLSPLPLLNGEVILRELHLSQADLRLSRDASGQLDIGFATGTAAQVAPGAASAQTATDVRALFALVDRLLASPLAAELVRIEAQDLRLGLWDARMAGGDDAAALSKAEAGAGAEAEAGVVAGAQLQGIGQLRAQRNGRDLALNLRLALLDDGRATGAVQGGSPGPGGQVDLALTYRMGSNAAQLVAEMDRIYARDLARQAAPLAFMAVLDAPISGEIRAGLSPQGLGALWAKLALGPGVLNPMVLSAAPPPATGQGEQPGQGLPAAAVPFQSAELELAYDPAQGRIALHRLSIGSQSLTLRGSGQADLRSASGAPMRGPFAGTLPAAFDVQLHLDQLRLARPEIFAQPVVFDGGTAQLRVTLSPFAVDIAHLGLSSGPTRLAALGQIAAQGQGWSRRVHLTVNQIAAGKVLGLWPKSLLPATRSWLDRNLLAARFADLRLSLNQPPGAVPDLALSYRFEDMVVTPVAGLPAIRGGAGRGQITGRAFALHLDRGTTTPPLGGEIDLAGSDFVIPDIRRFPAMGELTLRSAGSLTATLSLIDQRPLRLLSKAGQKVDLASGTARLTSHLRLPLLKIVTLPQISFQIRGQISDFASDRLVAGHRIALPAVSVSATKAGLRMQGRGQISGVAVAARYVQGFGKGGVAQVQGELPLQDDSLRVFGLRLPRGMVQGSGLARVKIDLPRGQPAELTLTSDLRGVELNLPELAYRKAAKSAGDLRARITLSRPLKVTDFALNAGALQFRGGSVALNDQGALRRVDLPDLSLGDWLAGDVALLPQGAGRPLRVELGAPSGPSAARIDLRFMPRLPRGSNGTAEGLPLSLRLDRLRVSDAITLRDFRGDFLAQDGGLAGAFTARLAKGGAALQGQLRPSAHGTSLRALAEDAGQALAQAGIYRTASGGQLDLRLVPMEQAGHYQGQISMTRLRVQNNSVLADLLNAISVVGLLDQLGGAGILFNRVTGQFLLTPAGIDLREGVATGASLGVTLQGIYRFAQAELDMQGVISPIYMLNGVGEVISARGEGLLGFNYRLRGAADAPRVRVNPLSVLLPGFLRNLFKPPPASLQGEGP